ncbi:MAG TPA: DUF2867 domain-containing protein [Ktedonobacteraceae bacterium]|jgi:hypothetical protein|nr:DUF2867 domain-containing protein [Ktedonobacteraceae bacterium]
MGRWIDAIRMHRVAVVVQTPAANNSTDYRVTFEVPISKMDTRTAEQWVRAIFEDAPRPVRWFLLLGWRGVLGLRLGPRASPDHILGWQIVSRDPREVRLELHSALMKFQQTWHLSNSTAVWSTIVSYKKPLARPLWAVVGVIHRQMVPYLLGYAASCQVSTTPSSTA